MSLPDAGTNEFEKLRAIPLRDQVYSRIKSLILVNRLLPGQQITIDQLVKQLGVSHTPIREALAALERDNLVVMEHHKNLRITEITARDVHEVYEVRLLLEGWAAAQAAIRMPPDKLEVMYQLQDKVTNDVNQNNYDTYFESDIALHDTILQTAENGLFMRVNKLVNDQSTRIRSLVEAARPTAMISVILFEHRTILDAIKAHDADQARRKMEFHLDSAMGRTISVLDQIHQVT